MKAALPVLMAALALAGPVGAEVLEAGGGVIRTLDRYTGQVADVDLRVGDSTALGKLQITMDACRYPADLPLGEAFAHLTILDPDRAEPLFRGWMIASSPALSSLDHQRYDVWVMHCDVPAAPSTSEGEGSGG